MRSVVVVNWNAGAALVECLASLEGDHRGGAEVVVVDNGCSDDSTAAAVAHHPWVRTVATGTNGGFAAGANAGAEVSRGSILIFLNPDATVEGGAIGRLTAALADPGVAIAGGGLRDRGGRWQPAAARFSPVPHLLLDTTPGRVLGRWRRRPHRVDWVYGTFMAIRADVFRGLGGFDPSYFLYGEDADLCYRARQGGWTTLLVPGARAVHGPNVSARQRFGTGREAAVIRGELRFYATCGPVALRRFRRVAAAKFALKVGLAAMLRRRQARDTYAAVLRTCRNEDPQCQTPA